MWFPYAAPFYVAHIGEMRPKAIGEIAVRLTSREPKCSRLSCLDAGPILGA
jgi:hypothetical protein